jgi:hypothetical protein
MQPGTGIEREIHRSDRSVVENMGAPSRVPTRLAAATPWRSSSQCDVDTSVIPHMDFSNERGPDFGGFSVQPSTFGMKRRLLELPCTIDFTGHARRIGDTLHRAASAGWLQKFRAVGILARSGVLNKVMLSPEGNTLEEMKALTRALHADGVRTFAPRFTARAWPGVHVRSAADLKTFLLLSTALRILLYELGGRSRSEDLYSDLVAPDAGASQFTRFVQSLPPRSTSVFPLDKDSTVTIVEDGVITYAAAEERFTRVKLQNGFPWQALEDAMERTGTKSEEIDRVVYPFLPDAEETRLFERNLQKERGFLEETEASATTEEIQKAKARVPARRAAVPGLSDPRRQEKGLLRISPTACWRAKVVSARVKAWIEQGRDATKFTKWQ